MQQEDVFHAYKPLLFSIAYNMLGSVMDAEDCVQEALLRWYQACNDNAREAVSSPKSYLSAIVTHLCIDYLRSARVQREQYVGVWLPEPLVISDEDSVTNTAELTETLSVAFLYLLERLSPIERAVFLLRQVFDYEYGEIAAIVQKSEDNCRQIVRRARQHLRTHRPGRNASKEQQDHILRQFIHACTNGDMDGLLALLAQDIVSYADGGGKVAVARNPIFGAHRVARYLLGLLQKAQQDVRFCIARVNGQPGMIIYLNGAPSVLLALDILNGHIQEIDVIANPNKLQRIPAFK